ncbi:Os07g0154900 [Oryza sativa Japonica Group]|uniref:cDNA clone:001-109-E02, full insert sequence n=2 Tax=Oryza sativa subsp. japonica TaxID=39947 RepID=Q0D8J2_ORYSJ|nr:Os07g0154900 [Oryza sativa Japonica Group]BAG88503.1 unnamed protein product [Oryza sativa Japonica Group]|eukprot:NP_001058917.1 Os07g0154900 [Oryza sativa Japonica Group]
MTAEKRRNTCSARLESTSTRISHAFHKATTLAMDPSIFVFQSAACSTIPAFLLPGHCLILSETLISSSLGERIFFSRWKA